MNIALNDTAHQAIFVQLSGKKYPYSPWQNGKVKRGHREDGKILYGRKVFTSEKEFIKQVENMEQDITVQQIRRMTSNAQTKLYQNSSQCVTYV